MTTSHDELTDKMFNNYLEMTNEEKSEWSKDATMEQKREWLKTCTVIPNQPLTVSTQGKGRGYNRTFPYEW